MTFKNCFLHDEHQYSHSNFYSWRIPINITIQYLTTVGIPALILTTVFPFQLHCFGMISRHEASAIATVEGAADAIQQRGRPQQLGCSPPCLAISWENPGFYHPSMGHIPLESWWEGLNKLKHHIIVEINDFFRTNCHCDHCWTQPWLLRLDTIHVRQLVQPNMFRCWPQDGIPCELKQRPKELCFMQK